jgi:hypothetical protein
MAHFYGNLKGARGERTACGTRNSGIRVSARSWDGSVTVHAHDHADGTPRFEVYVSETSSTGGHLMFSGTVDELIERLRP